jgi:branched-chain amino acid transport system ATP-binding protein
MVDLLKTINLSKRFGGLSAVEKVNMSIGGGEKVVGIIGPNGSGKTTFFNLITGLFRPNAGQIIFQGEEITRKTSNQRVLKGMARTFQLVSVFDRLTPWENLVLSSTRFEKEISTPYRFMLKPASNNNILDKCYETLRLLGLEKVATAKTSELSYGSKRMLEIGIALSLKPKLLLLDEPLAGLSDFEIVEVVDVLIKIKSQLHLIIIEHKLSKILDLVDRFIGHPAQVLSDEAVRECYWGKAEITDGAA